MKAMKRAVCLLSGGPDSATAAALAKSEGNEIYCLTFDYGQIATRELEAAKDISKFLGAKEHRIIDISFLKGLYGPGVTALTDERMPMPGKFEPSVVVPFRNGILIAIAAGYAATIGANRIYYGPQLGDAPFYPDCRKEFVEAMSEAVKKGTDLQIEVKNPLADKPKSEVFKLASKLGVSLEITWSCYLNGDVHCGECESCRNRSRAFVEAGIADPTVYKVKPR